MCIQYGTVKIYKSTKHRKAGGGGGGTRGQQTEDEREGR
jgi:hypothetical protein